jgi:uncharacterized protein YkwD
MASVLDDGDRYAAPSRRPTSHRRKPRRRRLRASAITAAVAGIAIAAPLALRPDHGSEVTIGGAGPLTPPSISGTTPAAPSADTAAAGGRSGVPVSRDATRTAASQILKTSQTAQTPQTSSGGVPTVQLSPDEATSYEEQVVALTNDQRAAHGCPTLRDDPRLRAAAIGHSVDMRARDYFAHSTPDGVTPWARIEARGYPDPSAENIAMGQATAQEVVDAWMNSPGHRANILNCASHAIGVGVQFGPGGPWWTQDFGYS